MLLPDVGTELWHKRQGCLSFWELLTLRLISCVTGLSGVDAERLDQPDGQQGARPCTCCRQGSCQAGRHQGRRQGSAVAHRPPPGAGARAQRRLCDTCIWPGDIPPSLMASLPALQMPGGCRRATARCCCASAAILSSACLKHGLTTESHLPGDCMEMTINKGNLQGQ